MGILLYKSDFLFIILITELSLLMPCLSFANHIKYFPLHVNVIHNVHSYFIEIILFHVNTTDS